MKYKIVLLLIFIFHFTFLISDTIIDSVYSDPILDGEICFSQNAQGYIINNWMYDMFVGDSGVNIINPDPNSYIRSFVSFYLPQIPNNYHIDSVFVRLYQYDSCGYDASTGTYTDFPVWDVAGGDTIKCVMSHIDYGNELDIGDWEKGDVGNSYTYQNNIGTITESGEDGYRYLDVTPSVILDYELNRDKTQYRLAFQIDTDWDYESDLVAFITSSGHQYDELNPTLYLTFSDDVNSTNEELSITNSELRNYPNPFNPVTTINYSLANEGNIVLIVYNIKGQKVKTLVKEIKDSGHYQAIWDGTDNNKKQVASGVYFYRLTTSEKTLNKKMLLLK